MQSKKCQVEGCNNPRWGGGYCSRHQNLRKDKKPKGLNPTRKKEDRPSYVPFYAAAMAKTTGYCQECGHPIERTEFYIHASIAHVLPKSKFPSVAFHPDNWIELGTECGCHNRYDTGYKTAQTMKVWPIAREKFQKFRAFILTEDEKRRIPPEIE